MARRVWGRVVALCMGLWLTAHEWLLELGHHGHERLSVPSPHAHVEQASVLAQSAASSDAVLESGNRGDAGGAFPVPLLKPRQRRHEAYDYGWEDGWAAIRAHEQHRRSASLLLLLHPAGGEPNAAAG